MLTLPLEVRTMSQRIHHPANLPTSTRYAYAQTLAETLHAYGWTNPAARLSYGDEPPFRVYGGGIPTLPAIIEARTDGHEKASVPPAKIKLGRTAYVNVLITLDLDNPNALDAWFEWLQPRRDKYGTRLTPPALFRPHGPQWSRSAHTDQAEQNVALKCLEAATITTE